jgi:hypothetical protein
MQALAANHDLLIRNEWQGVAVVDLQHFPVILNRKDSQSVRDERVFRH